MSPKPHSLLKQIALWMGIIPCAFITMIGTMLSVIFLVQIFDPTFASVRDASGRIANTVGFFMFVVPTLLFAWLTKYQYCTWKAGRPKPPVGKTPNLFVCAMCGMEAATINVSFHRHFGAVILMFHRDVRGRFCRPCISRTFWNWTPLTFLFGWWGIISAVITPIVVISNLVMYFRSFGMSAGRGTRLVFGDSEIAAVSSLPTDIVDRVNSGEDPEAAAKEIATATGLTPAQAYVYLQYRLTQPKEPSLVG